MNSINLDAASGEVIGLLGPNGSGKSSLLKLIYRVYRPDSGEIRLDQCDMQTLTGNDVAQRVAVVSQESPSDFDFTVEELVMMGRTPYKRVLDRDTVEDETIVAEALARVGITQLASRLFHTLSGGEKQLVLIARALSQQTKVLVLDEPTNHLDIRYQLEILELVRSLGVTTIIALHDLNLAARYCDRIYLLRTGEIVAHGTPREVFHPEVIESVYGVKVEVGQQAVTGQMYIFYIGISIPSQRREDESTSTSSELNNTSCDPK